MPDIKFKTYSWSYWTTSFRVSELKYKIERQLLKLKQLYDENTEDYVWRDLQGNYFEMLLEEDWFNSTSTDTGKYARQVTSSLKDLWLVTDDRKLTNIWIELSKILLNKDYNFDNIFGIRNDSYLYIKQFLKLEFSESSNSRSYSEFQINPFIAIIYFITELDYITKEELTYLLPITKNYQSLNTLITNLKENRGFDLYKIITENISNMENYQLALEFFQQNDESIETFETILIDRKSKDSAPSYFNFYNSLKNNDINEIIKYIQPLPQKQKTKYYKQLFNTSSKPVQANIQQSKEHFETLNFNNNLKENFFYLVHFAKWTTNLEEYFDLNKRFLDLTDIFVFWENIELTPIPKLYFQKIWEALLEVELSEGEEEYITSLTSRKTIEEIDPLLKIEDTIILDELKLIYPSLLEDSLKDSIGNIIKQEKTDKFNSLIDNYFSVSNLQDLLLKIKDRNDAAVSSYLHWECDIPTVFEYLIGIVWYIINDRNDDISEFLNMTLDANLLPRRFAGGGQSDLIFKYDSHSVLIEVTLSQKENQRRMELEPVSRHLGKYRLTSNNDNDYAIFVAPHLDPNVLVNFRSYKQLKYYNTNNTDEYVEKLKIIPLSINDIVLILNKWYKKDDIEKIIESSFVADENDGFKRYKDTLQPNLSN